MIFLIEYNRKKGKIVTFKKFKDADRSKAGKRRLELELDLNRRGIQHEVVLLEAASEELVRKTHRRYFESLQQIAKSFSNLQ